MLVHQATLKDISSIAKIAQETYIKTFAHTMNKAKLKEELKKRNENYFLSVFGKNTILVAEKGGNILGFIEFGEINDDIELKKIYVDTKNQGKGIGKKLMEAMMKHTRCLNATNIFLDVYTENNKALKLYQSFGFKEVKKIPYKVNNKTVGYDILMKKTLSI